MWEGSRKRSQRDRTHNLLEFGKFLSRCREEKSGRMNALTPNMCSATNRTSLGGIHAAHRHASLSRDKHLH